MRKKNPIKLHVELTFDSYYDVNKLHNSLFFEESSPQLLKAHREIEDALLQFEFIENI